MNNILTIELKALHFFAYHGLYDEEKKIGNEFEINLSVSHEPGSAIITDISDTINYAKLHALVKLEMQKPRHLLETFVMEVAGMIHELYPQVKKIEIGITKMHVPVAKFAGTATVIYTTEY